MTVRDVGSVQSDLCISISDGCLSDQQKEEKRKRKTLRNLFLVPQRPSSSSSTFLFLNVCPIVKREDGEGAVGSRGEGARFERKP